MGANEDLERDAYRYLDLMLDRSLGFENERHSKYSLGDELGFEKCHTNDVVKYLKQLTFITDYEWAEEHISIHYNGALTARERRAAPKVKPSVETAVRLINAAVARLLGIIKDAQRDSDPALGWERVDRWQSTTAKQLRQEVGKAEGAKFGMIPALLSSPGPSFLIQFGSRANSLKAALLGLKEDIELNGLPDEERAPA